MSGSHAHAVRHPRHERLLFRPMPVGRRHRRLAVFNRVHHRHVHRLRNHHVLAHHYLQVSFPSTPPFRRVQRTVLTISDIITGSGVGTDYFQEGQWRN